MKALIQMARVPNWLKIKLLNVQDGKAREDRSYLDIGYHLGRLHLEDFCEDDAQLFSANEDEVRTRPSQMLRRVFASDTHPRGELTDLIPINRRREFLVGVLAGACEDDQKKAGCANSFQSGGNQQEPDEFSGRLFSPRLWMPVRRVWRSYRCSH
jgi:hypothetical protein